MAEKRHWDYLMERRKSDSEGYLEATTRWLTSSSILLFDLPGFLLFNYYSSLIHSYQQIQYCSYITLWCCYQFKKLLNVPFTFAFITNFRYWTFFCGSLLRVFPIILLSCSFKREKMLFLLVVWQFRICMAFNSPLFWIGTTSY